MGKLIDLTGQRFGRLVVVARAEDYHPRGNPENRLTDRKSAVGEDSLNP